MFALFASKLFGVSQKSLGAFTAKRSVLQAHHVTFGPVVTSNLQSLGELHDVKMDSAKFSLAGQGLKLDTADDVQRHLRVLAESSSLEHIDLSGNTFGVAACEALAPLLSSQHMLRSVDLHDIFTSRKEWEIPEGLQFLLNALLQCPQLHTIDLSDNAFGLQVVVPAKRATKEGEEEKIIEKALLNFLSRHTPLKHLILNNNGMGPEAGALIANALAELAERKAEARKQGLEVPYLESIVCGRNRLENGSMKAWAQAYEAHKSGMKSVKMTQNGIRPEGISLLLRDGLGHCSNLETLDMQDNTFTFKGAGALADVIGGWSKLKELGVGDDLLGATGAIKVFEKLAVGHNKEVELLRLQFNDITTKGVEALLRAGKEGLPKLRRVELNGNKFSEDDAHIEAIAEMLSERKEEFGSADDPEEHWGVDELDEMEEEDSDEDETEAEAAEEEEEEEEEKARERALREAEEAEDETVALKEDADVDELADILKKTEV